MPGRRSHARLRAQNITFCPCAEEAAPGGSMAAPPLREGLRGRGRPLRTAPFASAHRPAEAATAPLARSRRATPLRRYAASSSPATTPLARLFFLLEQVARPFFRFRRRAGELDAAAGARSRVQIYAAGHDAD